VLRRSEGTCFSSSNDRSNRASEASTSPSGELWDEVGVLQGAIRARDVRAADLQEEPTKRAETELTLQHIVSSDRRRRRLSGEHRSERSEHWIQRAVAERSNQKGSL
jgi:hypothetical protein